MNYRKYLSSAILKNIRFSKFSVISVKTFSNLLSNHLGQFISRKFPCLQHILPNTFRKMRLKHDNYSLRCILFQTLKQNSESKNLVAKIFNVNMFKMKAVSPIQVIKNKKQYFQLLLDRLYTLVLCANFFACSIGHVSKITRPKNRVPRKKFVEPKLLHDDNPMIIKTLRLSSQQSTEELIIKYLQCKNRNRCLCRVKIGRFCILGGHFQSVI